MKILAVISHTEHFWDANGQIVGWGATVRELDHLTEVFDKVIHLACLYDGPLPAGMLPYESPNVEFVPLKPSGGESIVGKLDVLLKMPHNMRVVKDVLRRCDVFQFRAPTGMGVYMIPYLLRSGVPGWFKYAGNWAEPHPPLAYLLQRHYLKTQSKYIVTINGHWADQKSNQLTFENPCLTEEELRLGEAVLKDKDYSGLLNLAFVGRLEDAKGVRRLLNVLAKIDINRIGTVHLIGDGPMRGEYEQLAKQSKANIVFHGFLKRDEINEILRESHIFTLPSDSEGFPKVVAEAANFGLVPVVSDVSCIGQYIIDDKTGYLIPPSDEVILQEKLEFVLSLAADKLQRMAYNCHAMASKFTYVYYNKRIIEEIVEGKRDE